MVIEDLPMKWQDHIEQLPDVMLGKPVCRGTRITVEHVLSELGSGMSEEELLRGHPRLAQSTSAPLCCMPRR